MDFNVAGNLIFTNYGEDTLDVFTPDGFLVRRIFLPHKKVSNLHFLTPGSAELIVTERRRTRCGASTMARLDNPSPAGSESISIWI